MVFCTGVGFDVMRVSASPDNCYLMESYMSKILLVGEDLRLLETRAEVLGRIGVDTVCCCQRQMMRDLRSEQFDLVVLCHSLATRAANDVAAVARLRWPKAPIALLCSPLEQLKEADGRFDVVVRSDPARLVQATVALLDATRPAEYLHSGPLQFPPQRPSR
jgi:hypothetical protein